MKHCVSCGHELGVGRFCTNCGHPIDRAPVDPAPVDTGWRTDTAERVAVPPPPRFPLFADESPAAQAPAPPVPPPWIGPEPEPPYVEQRRPSWGLWVLLGLALVVVAGLGVWLLTDGDEPAHTTHSGPRHSSSGAPSARDSETSTASAGPSGVTDGATVQVPATAPPGQDVSGNPVDYEGENLLDGVPETTWRMPGDGTGREIVITLAAPTRLGSVGLINGYAKTASDQQGRELDWYHGNRRVTSVEWVFDDGTTVSQDLEDTTAVQAVDVDVTTTTVRLRLVTVSAPGTGRAARDYTAISDVSLVGAG